MQKVKNKLQVWHYPQVPCDPFKVPVPDEYAAKLVKDALADQHIWLWRNRFIPDYANTLVVMMYNEESGVWDEYYNEFEEMDWDELEEKYF